MNIEFTPNAWDEFNYWVETDISYVIKIMELVNSIKQDPFRGIGKPEPLKQQLKSFWSRRITQEHRLVYKITGKKRIDQKCTIVQCKYHYKK